MLTQVADGVLVHESEFIQSNAVVVQGRRRRAAHRPRHHGRRDGLPRERPSRVGPDRRGGLLDASRLGPPALARRARRRAPVRHGPLRGRHRESCCPNPDWKARVAEGLARRRSPSEVPLDLFGLITGLPAGTAQVPWDGPQVRIVEHQAHAPGHAALLHRGARGSRRRRHALRRPGSDARPDGAADPIEDYLAALRLLEGVAGDVEVVVPGHGSVGGAGQVRARIERDRAYVLALRDGRVPDDPRIGPSAKPGWEWVSDVHAWQLESLAQRSERHGTPD